MTGSNLRELERDAGIEVRGITRGPAPDRPAWHRVTATVDVGGRIHAVWFEAPESAFGAGGAPGNAWAAAMLPLAFTLRLPLRIEAEVDETLLHNLEHVSSIWESWFPSGRTVALRATTTHDPPPSDRAGLFFTAGVDSFYSLVKLAGPGSSDRLSDLIPVAGFDIPLSNRNDIDEYLASVESIAAAYGLAMVPVRTNVRNIYADYGCDWGNVCHGVALAACSYVLNGRFAQLYFRVLRPWPPAPMGIASGHRFILWV